MFNLGKKSKNVEETELKDLELDDIEEIADIDNEELSDSDDSYNELDTDDVDIEDDDIEDDDIEEDDDDDIEEEDDDEDDSDKTYNLFVITDRYSNRLINYYRSLGLNVSYVFNGAVDEAHKQIMLSTNARVVIIESGLGKLTGAVTREKLLEIISLCDGKDKKCLIFYTDSIMRSIVKNTEKQIKWKRIKFMKYTNTVATAAKLISMNENYVLTNKAKNIDTSIDTEALLNSRCTGYVSKQEYKQYLRINTIDYKDIITGLNYDGDTIKEYSVKY